MIKRTISYIIAILVVLICGNSAHAEKMDREWCITLLEIKDTASVPDSVAEPMALQCAIFQKDAIDAIKKICKMDDIDARKEAADMFNHQHKNEYNIYIQMVRAIREYMERKCLGSAATIMSYDIVKTNSEIDTMFTIFRSRRSLPNNKYTNPQ